MKIILIGSSPAMMLQALVLSQKYNDIEIHEGRKVIGGSWRTSNFFNLKSVETGTHIFAPWKNNLIYNESLKILKSKLGLKLFLSDPAPERIINKNIKKTELKKIKYYYVKGGAKQIIKNIKYLIKKKNIKIYTNSRISNITIDNKKKLFTSKNIFSVDQIYFPYYCNFNKRFLEKNNISLKKKLSVHLIIEYINFKKFVNNFSYIQSSKFSKWVDRASVLSKNILLKNKLLFCVRLSEKGKIFYKKNSFRLAKIVSNDLFNYLNLDKCKKKFKIRCKYFKYESAYRDKKDIQKLRKFISKKKLKLVDTSEFMKYLGKNLINLKKLDNYA